MLRARVLIQGNHNLILDHFCLHSCCFLPVHPNPLVQRLALGVVFFSGLLSFGFEQPNFASLGVEVLGPYERDDVLLAIKFWPKNNCFSVAVFDVNPFARVTLIRRGFGIVCYGGARPLHR
jgi:hypothetical protein